MPTPGRGRPNAMNEFSFTLVLNVSGLDDPQIAALYDHVPDATASERTEKAFIGIDRQAPDFPTAVVTAIEDVERALSPVRVIAIEPEDLVSQADIAQRQGRSRESIRQLVKGERGPGTFPKPTYLLADRGLWRWQNVETWFDDYEGRQPRRHHDAFIDAVNAVLAVRSREAGLAQTELSAVRRLARDTDVARA